MTPADVKRNEQIAIRIVFGMATGVAVILILLTLLMLSGCATNQVPVLHKFCLPMVSYSRQEQSEAAKELKKLGSRSELAQMITDYGKLRAADRACQQS